MAVQGGPGGPLRYAQVPTRQAEPPGASTTSPLQELDAGLSRTVTSLRDAPDPRALLDTPSLRTALPSRDIPPVQPTLFPRDGLPSRKTTTSLRDNALSRRQAGPSPVSGTGSASDVDTRRKRMKRSPQVFEGDAALKELRLRLAAAPKDQTPEPPLAPAKSSVFPSTALLSGVVLTAGGALGLLWVTPANQQAREEVALVSRQETPSPVAQNVAGATAPDPSAKAEQAAAGEALYDDFLKWWQRLQPRLTGRQFGPRPR